MEIVMLYRLRGQYSGATEYDWRHPALGAIHDCLLFLRQQTAQDSYPDAKVECERYGFTDIQFFSCGKLDVETLNADGHRGFSGFYEEVMGHGSALVFYPSK
jgi:hypothetical protein